MNKKTLLCLAVANVVLASEGSDNSLAVISAQQPGTNVTSSDEKAISTKVIPTEKSTWTRLSYAVSGVAKVGVAGAITAATVYSGYTLFSWAASAATWLQSPIGLTACTQYVAETNGTVAATPLVYALAARLPEASTMCIGAAAGAAAKSYYIHSIAAGAALSYCANNIASATKAVGNFTYDSFSAGLSDLQEAFA